MNKFIALLDYLSTYPKHSTIWNGWTINLIEGGSNNLIYRVSGVESDFAVKWTIRDARNRAGREYAALTALQEQPFSIAPTPILINQDRYQLPVVIQTWIDGSLLSIPQNNDEWLKIIEYYAIIHSITPNQTSIKLASAVVNANSSQSCYELIEKQAFLLPIEYIQSIKLLLNNFKKAIDRRWPKTRIGLCRVDSNPTNFIYQHNNLVSVDWENSGWGDPAFEIAEMMTHPQYQTISQDRWQSVIEMYGACTNDQTAPQRIHLYYQTMLVWWVLRFQRMLLEIPQGNDQRLVERPINWQADIQVKYHNYYNRALQILA